MRLDFNVFLIDDDINDEDDRDALLSLEMKVSEKIRVKGFVPVVTKYGDAQSAIEAGNKRVDLYLSDNNLGDHAQPNADVAVLTGIDFYLSLSERFICDFVLYTRSDKSEIVKSLVKNLEVHQNPNLFTRFTFVSRTVSGEWHQPILNTIDHILTKREEINNLRGLYAQQTAIIHNKLRTLIGDTQKAVTFNDCIKRAGALKNGSSWVLSRNLKAQLETHRDIRNGVIHNDEKFCNTRDAYYIEYESGVQIHRLYEVDFPLKRDHLSSTVRLVLAL
jgi:hypothetical protein